MAHLNNKFTVSLDPKIVKLLQDIRDELRKQNRDRDERLTRRLVEEQVRYEFVEGVVPQEAVDLPSASTIPYPSVDLSSQEAKYVGFTWNGSGWVPKRKNGGDDLLGY